MPAPFTPPVPHVQVVNEITRRLKHCTGVRQNLRDFGQLSLAALQTAKIDELTDLQEWVKMLPCA